MMRCLMLMVVLLLTVTPAAAQDDAWDIEQRCVGEPTTPTTNDKG